MPFRALVAATCLLLASFSQAQTIDAVTFAEEPGAIYVPVREASKVLRWPMQYDPAVELIQLRGETLDPSRPRLSDGTWLISLTELAKLGAKVTGRKARFETRGFEAKVGAKRVLVDIRKQVLRAWQGQRLVYQWPISSGREGKDTPNGSFRSGTKEPMHISTIYGSPMPFSVHITGNIFIHGSSSFSGSPGSHGCIRLPLMSTRNVAEEFYNWIDQGVPIRIQGAYKFQLDGANR